jgi:hypothetical protein
MGTSAEAQNQSDTNHNERNGANQQQDNSDQMKEGLPKAIEKLDLEQQQKQQIKQVLENNREELQQAWTQFHRKHMQAVALEAALVASLEGQLTDTQREQFREGRAEASRRSQHHSQSNDARTNRRDEQSNQNRNASGAQQQQSQQQSDPSQRGRQSEQASRASQDNANALFIAVIRPVHAGLDQAQLSESQKSECQTCTSKYSGKLQQIWSDIHELHTEMVRIEADKMTQIAQVLNKDQLQQLQEALQNDSDQSGGPSTASRQQDAQESDPRRE